MSDPWVPTIVGFLPLKKENVDPSPRKVSEFIDLQSNSWNWSLLSSVFAEPSIAEIVKIRIPYHQPTDNLIWTNSSSGKYTVKSGYDAIRTLRDWGLGNDEKRTLNNIWKAKIHNRHKVFLWRLVRGAILTRDVLSSRIPGIDTSCPLCQNHIESAVHIFWSCDVARSCWLENWGLRTNAIHIGSTFELVDFILNPPRPWDGNQCIGLWGIALVERLWKARNDLVFGDSQRIEVRALLKHINSLALEIQLRHTSIAESPPSEMQSAEFNGIKISCDAAIQPSLSMAACVARDNNNLNISFLTRVQRSSSPCKVEAIAIWEAVIWARFNNWSSCVFESDSQEVINAILNGNAVPIWEIKNTVMDIDRVARDFPDWNFKKIPRLMNNTAHSIAQTALRIALKHVSPLYL